MAAILAALVWMAGVAGTWGAPRAARRLVQLARFVDSSTAPGSGGGRPQLARVRVAPGLGADDAGVMSTSSALRRALAVLGVTGSLVPGVAAPLAPTVGDPSPRAAAPPAVDLRSTSPDVDGLRRTWAWPLQPRPAVTSRFVAPASTWGAGHRGLDLATTQGQQVLAVDDGVVTHVGVVAGRGTVSVTHASGLRSTYEPVNGEVAVGTHVGRAAALGVVAGRTHCGGACLHLGAVRGAGYVDPRPLLAGAPVILLPLGARR
ncbi:M23 family metallopeptidase [Rothia sp. ARF10]|nr:M23 family metallopeptidase [Rothia sp. ARF10]